MQVGLGRPNRAASSQLEALGKLAAPRWKIVHPHRAGLEYVQPIRIPGYSAENHGVFIGVELRLEMIARLSGYETRWERQAALGIKGKYHRWDYPTAVSIVNQLDRVGVLVVDAPPLGFEVWVRDEHFDRAKAILDANPLTEEELTYLATGALGEGPGTS